MERSSYCYKHIDARREKDENSTFRQLIPLIPDEVLNNPTNCAKQNFDCVVFLADISGFTQLSDKYQKVSNGASKLSMVLNFYLSIMVQEILSHNGDIIKYAGDAFLAIFRTDDETSMKTCVHNALDTAIIIQNNCTNYRTEIGVTLNVKLAISCGSVDFMIIGDDHSSHYALVGSPVWQVKSLQELILPGEILATWEALCHVPNSSFIFERVGDNHYYRILGFHEKTHTLRQHYEATLNFQDMQNIYIKTNPPDIDLNQNETFSRNYSNNNYFHFTILQ
jgi:class 3 adenylate cyclase